MAIGSNKGQWAVCDNVLLTFIAGEDLKYEDKVSLQPDGKTLLKDPDGEYQVYFPKSVASGKQVEVLELIQKGGSNDISIVSGIVSGSDLIFTKSDSTTFSVDVSTLVERQKYRGELNAATDSLPTVDVQVGDHWFITAEGDNFGNIEGVNTLSRGDLLFYLNLQGDNDPSNPQNWQGIQQNTNDAFTGFVSLEDVPQTVSLVANTPLTINALVLATGEVRHVTITDSTGQVITSGVSIIINGTQVILESNINLNNIVVSMSGVA